MKRTHLAALQHFVALVIIVLGFSACNKPQTSDNWKSVYEQAYKAHDYTTALVALNQLIISDSSNNKVYFDSMSFLLHQKTTQLSSWPIVC